MNDLNPAVFICVFVANFAGVILRTAVDYYYLELLCVCAITVSRQNLRLLFRIIGRDYNGNENIIIFHQITS